MYFQLLKPNGLHLPQQDDENALPNVAILEIKHVNIYVSLYYMPESDNIDFEYNNSMQFMFNILPFLNLRMFFCLRSDASNDTYFKVSMKNVNML